jgi:hypothetical protein
MRIVLPLLLSITGSFGLGAVASAQGAPATPASATASGAPSLSNPKATQGVAGQPRDSFAQIPTVKLEFKSQQASVPGAHGSSAFFSPIICSPAGIPFVSFIEPSDFGPQTVYSLDPKGGHAFSVKSVPGLYDINSIQGYFASESTVGILVNATRDDKKASNTISMGPGLPPRAVYTGEHFDYLVEFDSVGNHKATLELPQAYKFRRLAIFSDDTLLALAYDRANTVPRLFRLDSGGRITGSLEIPAKMGSSPAVVAGQSGDILNQVNAESSLSWWIFAPARQRVLLYQAHTTSPLLEVGAGGAVREVPLQAPKGYVLDDVISANDRWIMRFRKESLSDSAPIDARPEAKNYVLYELDPSDGSLRRQIELETGPFYSIACEQDGVFTAFSIDGEKVNLQTADLPR